MSNEMPICYFVSNKESDRNEKNHMKYASENALTDCTKYIRGDIVDDLLAVLEYAVSHNAPSEEMWKVFKAIAHNALAKTKGQNQ